MPTILAVEDNGVLQLLIDRFLRRDGHTVILAGDGAQALARMPEAPGCIITDLYMPHMDGFDLLMALRDNPRYDGVPIVLLTEETDEATLGAARELGADIVLGKPFSATTLREAVSCALTAKTDAPCRARRPCAARPGIDGAVNW